jgi:hypothetical protein
MKNRETVTTTKFVYDEKAETFEVEVDSDEEAEIRRSKVCQSLPDDSYSPLLI